MQKIQKQRIPAKRQRIELDENWLNEIRQKLKKRTPIVINRGDNLNYNLYMRSYVRWLDVRGIDINKPLCSSVCGYRRCDEQTQFQCASCHSIAYCSSNHQEWDGHRHMCVPWDSIWTYENFVGTALHKE
jgi:hypothetical protein